MNKNNPVKGLVKYSLYSASGHIIMSGGIVLGLGILMTAFGSTPTFPIFAITILVPASLASNAQDDKSNWTRFQLTMPVKRKDVILSKYVTYLIFLLMALVISGVFIGLARVLHEMNIVEYGTALFGSIEQLVEGFDPRAVTHRLLLVAIGGALIVCSLYYPLAYTLFKGKEEGLSLITLFFSVAIMALIGWLGFKFELSLNSIIALNVVVPVILFVVSYVITTKIYAKIDV